MGALLVRSGRIAICICNLVCRFQGCASAVCCMEFVYSMVHGLWRTDFGGISLLSMASRLRFDPASGGAEGIFEMRKVDIVGLWCARGIR